MESVLNFASDNAQGASPRIMAALAAANDGAAPSYGADPLTRAVEERIAEIFEHEAAVFLVATGTAANALGVAALVPPWGALVCHEEAHVATDECGAPEFFAGGCKLVGLPGAAGKIAPETLQKTLAEGSWRAPHHVLPAALSISQATEAGTVYRPEEVAGLAEVARRFGLRVHMDGARFANALVGQGCTAAELSWKAGVEVLSFGATKNGCLAAEALVFFDIALARDMAARRKRGGHLLSKGRFLGAQLDAYLAGDHWLELARHANAIAARLAGGLAARGVRLAFPVEANEVFPILTRAAAERLRRAGAAFYDWPTRSLAPDIRIGADEIVVRMIASFRTSAEDVDAFLAGVAA